ncbi:hypothetical protein ABZ807_17685 [Micromonospora sp. NPDC047548]|uniref:hypothetical protein n=1 Tax=Micromonospora sp. NPDC047548 TaxID=3155624 RepID=UPI0033FF3B6D
MTDQVRLTDPARYYEVLGRVMSALRESQALLAGDPRVGQPTQTSHLSRNPVGYFETSRSGRTGG